MLSMLALPLWHKADALTHQELTLGAFGYSAQHMAPPGGPVWVIGLLALASAGVAAYEIFQFKNRLLQLKLGALNMLLLVATFGVAFYFAGRGEVNLNIKLDGHFQPAGYLPTLALILNLLANRFIRRDEQLVRRSYDRLR